MSKDLTTPNEPDDGFSASSSSRRVSRGSYLRWNDKQHWLDRDGIPPPSPLLVISVNEIVRRWVDNRTQDIVDKPLPNPDELNAAIPVSEWELRDGKPQPPWKHTVVVYLVNLETGETYTYAHDTVGAHIAFDLLKEAVITMRAIRGTKCMPLVHPTERPMKLKFGMGKRPHFKIGGWKTPGEDAAAIPAHQPELPQLPRPAEAEMPAPTEPAAPAAPTAKADPISSGPQPHKAKPKAQVNVASETLSAMSDVKPVTSAEILDDELPC
jgi:hypothetical protein